MGALHGGNGGGKPPDGGGLPELPPEWGDIIIPDDPAALAAEAAVVRRQLRRYNRTRRWRRRFHLPPSTRRLDDADEPGIGTPLIVMAIAVIATLVSLFAIGWPAQRRAGVASGSGGPTTTKNAVSTGSGPFASLTLTDPGGAKVRLGDTLPAVVLIVDGCPCEALVSSTAAAVDPRVTVLVIAAQWPTSAAVAAPANGRIRAAAAVRRLADPADLVRTAIPALARPAGPAAALVRSDGSAVRTLPTVTSVDDFRADLPRLVN